MRFIVVKGLDADDVGAGWEGGDVEGGGIVESVNQSSSHIQYLNSRHLVTQTKYLNHVIRRVGVQRDGGGFVDIANSYSGADCDCIAPGAVSRAVPVAQAADTEQVASVVGQGNVQRGV